MTAQDLEQLGVIDRIVSEPAGGAHRDPQAAAAVLGAAIGEELDALAGKSSKQLRRLREDRFLAMGDPRKARVLVSKALADDPDHAGARALLAELDAK